MGGAAGSGVVVGGDPQENQSGTTRLHRACKGWGQHDPPMVKTESGDQYILVCPQMLQFRNTLNRSLVNPNQLRMYGTIVRDDPTADGDNDFGLIFKNLFVSFVSRGATIYFESISPTYKEVEMFCHQVIGPPEWDPATVRLWAREKNVRQAAEIAGSSQDETAICFSSVSSVFDEKSFDRMLLSRQVTAHRHSPITPQEISKKFAIGLETAKKTLQVTTQMGVRHAVHPIHRRYRADHPGTGIGLKPGIVPCLAIEMLTSSQIKNMRVFPTNDGSFKSAKEALACFIDHVGMPQQLWTDGAAAYIGKHTPFQRLCNRERIEHRVTELAQKNQNHVAERKMGEVKKCWKRRRSKKIYQSASGIMA